MACGMTILMELSNNNDSNSRLVVDEEDNGKFKIERVNAHTSKILIPLFCVFVISFP